MQKKQKQKNGFFRVFSSKLFLFLLIIVLAGIGKVTFEKYLSWNQARNTLSTIEKKVQEEKAKSEELNKKVDELQNEEYIERVIKEKLNLAKPGEKVIYILSEEEEGREEEVSKNEGLWEKLKEIFIK
jgi:cell division protein FtsB